MRSAIVLAGGPSRRLGRPKAFVEIGGVPLIVRVVGAASKVADELVVASRGPLATRLGRALPFFRIVRDRSRVQSPLTGLVAGAAALRGDFVLALACDLPFLQPPLLRLLFATARGRDAAVPRWPNGELEPLVAVYRRRALLRAARAALDAKERSNLSMIARLNSVRYIDLDRVRLADPVLVSFVNVNSPIDLGRARRIAARFSRGQNTR